MTPEHRNNINGANTGVKAKRVNRGNSVVKAHCAHNIDTNAEEHKTSTTAGMKKFGAVRGDGVPAPVAGNSGNDAIDVKCGKDVKATQREGD